MRRRYWLGMFTLLLLLTAAMRLAMPSIIARVATTWLGNHGFTVKEISITSIGWREGKLARLHLMQPDGRLEIDLAGIKAGYALVHLLEGRLDSLAVNNLSIRLHPSTQHEAVFELNNPASLIDAIPVQQVQINDLNIQLLDERLQVLQSLEGRANFLNHSVGIELHEFNIAKGLDASLNLDVKGRLKAHISRGQAEILRLDGSIKETSGNLQFDSTLHANLALLDREVRKWVDLPKHRAGGNLNARWQFQLPAGKSINLTDIGKSIKATADVSLSADVAMPDSADSKTVLLRVSLDYDKGQGKWQVDDNSLLLSGAGKRQARVVPVSMKGGFEPIEQGWRISVSDTTRIRLEHLKLGDSALSSASLGLLQPVQIEFTKTGSVMLSKATALSLHFLPMQYAKYQVQSSGIILSLNPGPINLLSGNFDMQGLELTGASAKLPSSRLKGSFDVIHKSLKAAGTLVSNNSRMSMDWNLQQGLDNRYGEVSFTLRPLSFGAGGIDLAKVVNTKGKVVLQGGTLAGSGRLSWVKGFADKDWRMQGNMALDLRACEGLYKDNAFSGLNINLPIAISPDSLSLNSAGVSISEINAGVPIHNIRMDVSMKFPLIGDPMLDIKDLQAEALGGQISSDRIAIDFTLASNPFTVNITGLDARQLANIHKQEGLNADGILDGTLPFDWTKDGLRLVQGRLVARDPGGVIQYLGTEAVRNMAANQLATRMALDILSDFHYKNLMIEIDSEPDGEMRMQIRLKGNNPEYEKGRPIEFNLAISENVLKLLYSLRVAEGIGGQLERRVQQKLQKQ